MPHIDIITPEQADGETAIFFRTVQELFGSVPEPLQLFANNPLVAQKVFEGFGPSMVQTSLSQPFFAWIRYLVANHTHCNHCIDVNRGMLLSMGVSQDELAAAYKDTSTVPLPEKEKALLSACLSVVRDHKKLEKTEIDALQQQNLSHSDLVTAFHHAAHSQAVDLMINAFGL